LFVRAASVLRLKLEFAPPATPPGVASVARTYFKFTATPTWPHAVRISPLGIVAIGAITLIILTWAVCAYFASRRTAAQAKELEHRIVERTTELTAVNEQLRKEILERQRGIGLGLPISRSIIESLGGRLWATSGISSRSHFSFHLARGGPSS
jgi:C4-dicarboxylate-specific signal transduction histidine kinase